MAESKEPAFLRRIRSEHASGRHESPIARPRKHVEAADEDDEPTYIVENSQETMSRDQYDALVEDARAGSHQAHSQPGDGNGKESKHADIVTTESTGLVREQFATIGGANKKRQAKVIGGDYEKSQHDQKKYKAKKSKKVKLSFDQGADADAT
ncbi:MAG: hypothetical protein Q9217_000339 [Psora testacea]